MQNNKIFNLITILITEVSFKVGLESFGHSINCNLFHGYQCSSHMRDRGKTLE